MMIIIKITDNHLLKSDAYSIGRRGENEAEIIQVILPKDLQDKWLFLEFEKPDGTKFVTPKIEIFNGVGEYSISGNLLDQAGMLKLEVVLRDENGVCWKSESKKYSVIESINASDEVEKSNPDFITEAQKVIEDVETKLDNGEFDGEDGATFIPNVDNEGNISWTNDKGLTNPKTVNIQGVGIASIEQTVTSTNNGGINIVEITLDNGEKFIIKIRNGTGGEGGGASYDDTELIELIGTKVDKVVGKSLISDAEIIRLKDVTNYNDTELRELINSNLEVAKEYTDTEIANFDFVKIVDELPETGLPNRVYFVPKQQSETNNIFSEHAWINNKWEDFGTKIVEVDLTDVNASIENLQKTKVDKVEGKSLILDSEIQRLGTLKNYDDTEIRQNLEEKQDKLTAGNNITIENGVISATGGGSGGTSSEVYSTEETVIGTWIDGKPLYRKVVDCGAMPNNEIKTIQSNISDMDFLISISGIMYNPTSTDFATLPYIHAVGIESQIMMYYTKTTGLISIRARSDRTAFKQTYAFLEYTKTTD